jgi:hypothetical protein
MNISRLAWIFLILPLAMPVARTTNFTPHGTQPGLVSPLLGSRACAGYHADPGAIDRHFMPYNAWSGSMMADAARDLLFWAALDVANIDVPPATPALPRASLAARAGEPERRRVRPEWCRPLPAAGAALAAALFAVTSHAYTNAIMADGFDGPTVGPYTDEEASHFLHQATFAPTVADMPDRPGRCGGMQRLGRSEHKASQISAPLLAL